MSANLRTFLAVLVLPLCVFAAVVISSMHTYHKSAGLRESEEIYKQINDLNQAFHRIHQKLAEQGTNPASGSAMMVPPKAVRTALSNGLDPLGTLPSWVVSEQAYSRTGAVAAISGKIICFVEIGKAHSPYGLDTTGGCRFAHSDEVPRQEFEGLRH
jgi:hypothetical protein